MLTAALLLGVVPAAASPDPYGDAASPAIDMTPRFFIETIAVEGVRRASPAVIVSESLLAEGHSYTETELRQAVYRIRRLPFVLDAGFSLGKGSERGHYRLLIGVEEVHSFFFGADLLYKDFGDSLTTATRLKDDTTKALSAGIRLFAGQGVFFAAVADLGDLQLGYERYRLLDSPVFLRLAYGSKTTCCSVRLHELGLDPAAGTWTADDSERAELTVGVPMGGNHSLRLDATYLEADSALRRSFGYETYEVLDADGLEESAIELAWVYDTTDDPVSPTRGDAFTAAVGLRRLDAGVADRSAGAPAPALAEMRSRLVGLTLLGTRHWPATDRQTVSLSLKLLLSRSDVDNVPVRAAGEPRFMSGHVEALEAELGARYSLALAHGRRIRGRGDLRWENVASLLYVAGEAKLLGTSEAMEELRRRIARAAPTDGRILIRGESGTGKELVADALHRGSPRRDAPFIKINCASIPTHLVEDELFGHVRGAFTDARASKAGLFEEADGGTLFLDEIGDMDVALQARLLRVLEDGRVRRLGESRDREVDVRVIAATHHDLEQTVQGGAFREDLYFRLAHLPIEVPPLRQRGGDVRLLFVHFVESFCQRHRARRRRIDDDVFPILEGYGWPGNVRELKNVCERLVVFGGEALTAVALPSSFFSPSGFQETGLVRLGHNHPTLSLKEFKTQCEKEYIESILQRTNWNVSAAARILDIQRTYLHQKAAALGLRRPQAELAEAG